MGETDGRSDEQGGRTRVFWTVTPPCRGARSQTKVCGTLRPPPTSHWCTGEEKVMKETRSAHGARDTPAWKRSSKQSQ